MCVRGFFFSLDIINIEEHDSRVTCLEEGPEIQIGPGPSSAASLQIDTRSPDRSARR